MSWQPVTGSVRANRCAAIGHFSRCVISLSFKYVSVWGWLPCSWIWHGSTHRVFFQNSGWRHGDILGYALPVSECLRKMAKPHHMYWCHIKEGPFLFEQFKQRVIPSLGSASLPLYLLSASNRALFYIYWLAQKWVRNLLPRLFLNQHLQGKKFTDPQIALKTADRCYQPKSTCWFQQSWRMFVFFRAAFNIVTNFRKRGITMHIDYSGLGTWKNHKRETGNDLRSKLCIQFILYKWITWDCQGIVRLVALFP